MTQPLSPKQIEFIRHSTRKWNLAHGSVRSGKTVCTVYAFLHSVSQCPGSKIYIIGHTFDSAYRNIIRLIMESKELSIFRPFASWSGKKLHFDDKVITVLGSKDEGAIKQIQGDTYDLVYLDEATLCPESILDMIDSRLSPVHAKAYAAMNPTYPSHKMKQWIDKAQEGDPTYYALHFTLDDNPYVDESYKKRIQESSSGLFYKRNYLGLWCIAEGAIFDFFDRSIHVVSRPPCAAEYWIAGIDFGISNAFACLLIGVSTGQYTGLGKKWWVEKEYYWDSKKMHRQKTVSELAEDVVQFLEVYAIRAIYIDPSAAAMKVELKKRGIHTVDANNDVIDGIRVMTSEMSDGKLKICKECINLIKEIENYVWDERKAKEGEDAPIKKADHAVDALRYCVATHKITISSAHSHSPNQYMRSRFGV